MPVTESTISRLAEGLLGHPCDARVPHQLRLFKAHFGVSPFIASCLWNRMEDERTLPLQEARPTHLLWALMFLKLYSSEDTLSRIVNASAKTFRQRVWQMLEALNKLDAVRKQFDQAFDIAVCISLLLVDS
jgi:hypothetical protein